MAGRGEYRKQLAALWATAKAQNLKFKDIVPENMEEEFSHMKEIQEARDMVKSLQGRENQLQAAKEGLIKNLNEKQAEIDNLPAEYHSAKIDLQQARRQIANNKDTIDDLNNRIERYRAQAKEIVAKKQTNAAAAENLENLQMEVQNQQTIISKLKDDNRKSAALFEQLRETDRKALMSKDRLLEKKDKELAERTMQLVEKDTELLGAVNALEGKDKELAHLGYLLADLRHRMQKSNDENTALEEEIASSDDNNVLKMLVGPSQDDFLAMQAENIDLLQRNLRLAEDNHALEEQHIQMKTQLREALTSHGSSDRIFAAVVSETKTLFRFYQTSSHVIGSFADFFAAEKDTVQSLSNIGKELDSMQEALSGYFEVKNMVRAIHRSPDLNDTEQVALCKELDSLAATASESVINLENLHIVLWSFLDQLSHDPKMMSDLNGALCDKDWRRARLTDKSIAADQSQ
ncbi:hypothetical protein E8E12_009515 [Didymella heteroderae]|uniref:Uncharacterized protein n=1 Tax=Didymella heteroderae TaxID=1769908 RepID=A0A9P4WTV7_9PLEO|nr:hypothetical protein E8E12_009515 [Didymella heteroderae]